jgi:hypothetical protein
MINVPQVDTAQQKEMLDFYRAQASSVKVITCDKCKTDIAIEVMGDSLGMQKDKRGVTVIPIGEKLLASRVRLDMQTDGSPMVGYECTCGNDTRLASIEKALVPTSNRPFQLMPHEEAGIAKQIADSKYVPKVKYEGKKVIMESFTAKDVS